MKLGPQRNYHKGWAAIRHYTMLTNLVFNVKVVVATFKQEKVVLVGAVSVKTDCETDGSSALQC